MHYQVLKNISDFTLAKWTVKRSWNYFIKSKEMMTDLQNCQQIPIMLIMRIPLSYFWTNFLQQTSHFYRVETCFLFIKKVWKIFCVIILGFLSTLCVLLYGLLYIVKSGKNSDEKFDLCLNGEILLIHLNCLENYEFTLGLPISYVMFLNCLVVEKLNLELMLGYALQGNF